jgi:hypothetical protein
VYDDSGNTTAPVFDASHPALALAQKKDRHIWVEVQTRRAYLDRLPISHAEVEEGIREYRRWFGCDPESIVVSLLGHHSGVLLNGKQTREEYLAGKPQQDAEEDPSVDIKGLLRWRYLLGGEFQGRLGIPYSIGYTAEELVWGLSPETLWSGEIPPKWRPSVRAFRKLSQKRRLHKAKLFLEDYLTAREKLLQSRKIR